MRRIIGIALLVRSSLFAILGRNAPHLRYDLERHLSSELKYLGQTKCF